MELKLTPEQISQMLSETDSTYISSRDSFGALTIDETSNFPQRLKFYMSKNNKSVKNIVEYFKVNYPSLLSSSSSVHHYLRGIRTPKLSVLLGIAECLNIAPSNLLPGKAGSYMVKEDDHVELISISKSEDNIQSEEISEFNPTEVVEMDDVHPNEESDFISEDISFDEDLAPIEETSEQEDNNVVVSDPDDDEDNTDSFDDDTISIDEPSDDELSDLENEIEEGLDSFDDIFSDDDDDIYSADDKDSQSDTMSWIKFTE
tara:strand:- start:482 stop:1261 length:780 start_codon:yes stop_codon:yes gene_type:complete